jgi:transposase InsO family protein
VRYEWPCPGQLLHMDTKRLQRFAVAGHWATAGERTELARTRGAGYVYAHCVIDDHSRLAYVELHATDTGQAAAITLRRAAAWLTEQGTGPTEAVMTDNARVYGAHVFQRALADIGARHIRTPPYTPRWNGKVERFIQTLDDEWAHGRVWPSSTQRDRGLASWLRFYNRRRPHTSLGDRPPISRVHQDRGHDS